MLMGIVDDAGIDPAEDFDRIDRPRHLASATKAAQSMRLITAAAEIPSRSAMHLMALRRPRAFYSFYSAVAGPG